MRVGIHVCGTGGGVTQDQLSSWSPGSSDAELISAVRNGATAAFGVLFERHGGAARTVARQYMPSNSGADDVVADAFAKILAVLIGGRGPSTAFRAYLFTVVRRLAYVAVNQSRRVQPTDDAGFESVFGPSASSEEPALEAFERSTVAKAYKALPERWQAALWYSEVEGLTPAQFAPSLGLTANGAAALAYRAREGLRQEYLHQHLTAPPDPGCARTNPLLAGYVRGGLAKRDITRVEDHLESCGECRGLLVELGDVSHGMRAIIAPLVLGIAGVSALSGGLPLWGAAAAAASEAATGAAATGAAATGSAAGTAAGGSVAGAATSTGAAGSAGSATGGATGLGGAAASATTAGAVGASTIAAGAIVATAATTAAASEATSTTAATTNASSAGGSSAAGSAGSAAVGTAGGTGTAAGTGAVAATGAAGLAAGAGATGIAALVASVPALFVAAAAVVVIGAGVAVSAALGVFSTEQDTPAQSAASASTEDSGDDAGTDSSAGDQPLPVTPSMDPSDPVNTIVPSPTPTADGEATAQSTGPAKAAPPPPGAQPPPAQAAAADPSTTPTQAPTSEPTADPTSAPTEDPTSEPTASPTPPAPGPAVLQVIFNPGISLVARQDNAVAFSLSNTGGTTATNVVVSLTVPGTLRFVPEATSGGIFGPRILRTAEEGWTCTAVGPRADTQTVRCVVDEIAPATEIAVNLTFYAEDAVTADLAAQVFVGEDAVGEPWPFTSPIHAAPARLTTSLAPVAELVADQPGYLALTVANTGQLTAVDPRLALALPLGSGLTWRTDPVAGAATAAPGAVTPAPGSTAGWECAVTSDELACVGPQIDGDESATVVVPVEAGAEFSGAVTPTATFTGSTVPAGDATTLSVRRTGLSAASILEGPLQVAHVAGRAGSAPQLTLPIVRAGTNVRQATLTWSGEDAQGLDAAALSTVELRTDAGGFAREQVVGAATVHPPTAAGSSSYWGAADVTALVADHMQGGRWLLAAAKGGALPADLAWSLTVVYEQDGLADATVTVLLGSPALDTRASAPDGAGQPVDGVPAAGAAGTRTLVLPAPGPVRVAMTGTVRGAGDVAGSTLTVNGFSLAPAANDLPGVVTYRSDDLLPAPPGTDGPLSLVLEPGEAPFTVLAVHAATTPDHPAPGRSGVLDQPQSALTPMISVDVAESVEIDAAVQVPVTVTNLSGFSLADVDVSFSLPAGVAGAGPVGGACTTTTTTTTEPADVMPDTATTPPGGPLAAAGVGGPSVLNCTIGELAAEESTVVLLTLTTAKRLVLSGEVSYAVTGTDPVTGGDAESTGSFAVTAVSGVGVRGTWHGSVAVTEVGAPLMRCSLVGCWLAGTPWWSDATNDLFPMRPLNDAGGGTSSSSATVTIPDGATVKHAGLYWSANHKAGGEFSQDLTSVRLRAPGSGFYAPVTGEVLGEGIDSTGRTAYQAYADVTQVVAAHGAGEWSVADIALAKLPHGSSWIDQLASLDLYAGWSLVVVYEDTALPDGSVTIVDGPVVVTAAAGLTFDILGASGTTTTLGAVAWDGDRHVSGDQLVLNSAALRPVLSPNSPGGGAHGSASDAFNTTAWGSSGRYENSLGVDAKKFEGAPTQAGVNTISASTSGDEYVIGVVTVTTR